MKFFEEFVSNSIAGSGNQLFFNMSEGQTRTGRLFYKISAPGEYDYSLLFSNIMDSTYNDGSLSHKNLICDSWTIHGARVGRCEKIDTGKPVTELTVADEGSEEGDIKVFSLKEITFGGCATKTVMPGEFFSTDPISLSFDAGEYLCLEITFSGKMIPYHDETLLPVFVKGDEGWRYSKLMPFASMIGCRRAVKGRIAYLGDSITQGIGTAPNSYLHWNARFAEKIGNGYAHWNLGLGYGRAEDAASDGAWLYKAKQNDIIFVCYGVNDILQGLPEEQIKSDLTYIVKRLKECGRTVILQTVPPFDYNAEDTLKWQRINDYIKTELISVVDAVFDNVDTLGESEHPEVTKFGGHPDEIGCEVWANELYSALGHRFV